MENNTKVLIIPSWYPNKENTTGGGQFRHQSEFFLQRYDIRVLFGTKSALSVPKWVLQNGFNHAGSLEKTSTQSGLIEYRFYYQSFFKDEKHQIGSIVEGYKQALREIMKTGWKPDLIHARCTEPAGIVANYIARTLGIPWVLSEDQVFALGNYSDYRAKKMRHAFESASIVTVVSQHQLRSVFTHYIYRPMFVTGVLIDEDKFHLVQPHEGRSPFKVLTVMYPSPIKDPDTFFKAIAALVQKGHNDIEVTIIGRKLFSKDNIEHFQKLLEKYEVKEFCKLIPYVANSDMPRYYADSDVFVSTSLAETFGMAVREAMLVGRPVVCTASGGVDDDIFDFNGFKVNIYDHQAVADALILIKTGAVKYDPIRIRNYIVAKYGKEAYLERFSRLYDDALNKGK